jgi:hypothetical protein
MKKTIISLLLLSTVAVTPAFANWFSNPRTNTMLNVGSAPSPTPDDLRAIGDSPYAANGPYIRAPRPLASDVAPAYVAPAPAYVAPARVAIVPRMKAVDVDYKTVIGVGGQQLGTVIAFDEMAQQAELQLSTGVAITMPASLIVSSNGHLMAPTVSHNDVLAMAKTQTGRIVATNITIRSRDFRG